jgi:hypothetical protein
MPVLSKTNPNTFAAEKFVTQSRLQNSGGAMNFLPG